MFYIYVLICPETGSPRYIGKAKNLRVRLRGHICKAKGRHTKSHCSNWIRSLLAKGLAPTIQCIAESENDNEWQAAEREAIAKYRAMGFDLTNATSGGDGFHDLSPESQARRQAAWRKTLEDPIRKAAFVEASKKARLTPEVRKKQSDSLRAFYSDPDRKRQATAWMRTPEGIASKSRTSALNHSNPEYAAKHSERMTRIANTPEKREEARQRSLKAWSDPEITARRKASMKATYSKPEVRQKMSDINREIGSRPEVIAIKSEKAKQSWAAPDSGAKRRAALSVKATREKMSASARSRWADPEMGAAIRMAMSSPKAKANRSAAAIARSTLEYRAAAAERTRKLWEKRRNKQS